MGYIGADQPIAFADHDAAPREVVRAADCTSAQGPVAVNSDINTEESDRTRVDGSAERTDRYSPALLAPTLYIRRGAARAVTGNTDRYVVHNIIADYSSAYDRSSDPR
ncbi:hypothetical protein GCM10023319_44150 [Nocardia iowensis]